MSSVHKADLPPRHQFRVEFTFVNSCGLWQFVTFTFNYFSFGKKLLFLNWVIFLLEFFYAITKNWLILKIAPRNFQKSHICIWSMKVIIQVPSLHLPILLYFDGGIDWNETGRWKYSNLPISYRNNF